MERGEATIEQLLGEYPAFRSELEPMLRLAQDIRSLPKVRAPERLRSSSRPVFCPPRPVQPVSLKARWGGPLVRGCERIARSPFARLAAGFAVAVLLLGGTTAASAGSLPEEPLYPLKLAVEDFQLATASNPETRSELELQFVSRRLEEVESAARQGRLGAVQRGLALYEEKVVSALQRAESTLPACVEPVVEQQQLVLTRVLEQVPEQAKPSILHAMEVSSRGRDRSEKHASAAGGPVASGLLATPTASATNGMPVLESTPAADPRADATRGPAGKAKHEPTATAEPEEPGRERKPKDDKGQNKGPSASRGAVQPESTLEDKLSSGPKPRGLSPTSTVTPTATETPPPASPPASGVTSTPVSTPAATSIARPDRPGQGREKDPPRVADPTPKPANDGQQNPNSRKDSPSDKEERELAPGRTHQ